MEENMNMHIENLMNEETINKAIDRSLNTDKEIERIEKLANLDEFDKLGQQILDSDLPIDEKTDMYYKHREKRKEEVDEGVKQNGNIAMQNCKIAFYLFGGAVVVGSAFVALKNPDTAKEVWSTAKCLLTSRRNDNCIDVV